MFETQDGSATAWATRFTITDEKGNHGTLRPRIPPGGTLNPGGVGSIIPAPKSKKAPKKGAPAKAPPAKALPAKAHPDKAPAKVPAKTSAKTPAPKAAPAPKEALTPKAASTPAVPEAVADKKIDKSAERVANDPSLVHVDTSASNKMAANGVTIVTPWLLMVTGVIAAGTVALSML